MLAVAACAGDSARTSSPTATATTSAQTASPSWPPTQVPSAADLTDLAALHEAIERFTVDIEAYWTFAFPAVYGGAYTPISDFVAYRELRDAPLCDAVRLSLRNAYYCEDGDFIAWDERGLMLPLYQEAGDFALAFVLAHEWGHAVAARSGARLPETIFGELQADCFAGAYAAWAERNGSLQPGDLDEAIFTLYRERDPAGTPWLDPDAHGSAFERIGAFSEGYQQGPSLCANYSLPSPPFPPPG